MKQSLRLLFTLLLLVVYGGVCVGQTFKKVTEQSEIVAGGEYLIVSEKASKAYGGVNSAQNYGTSVDVTISNSTISSVGTAHIVKIGGETDKWTLYDENSQTYLALTSASKKLYSVSSETDNGTTWKITPTNITNVSYSSYKLQYNTSNPRFACYTSNQTAIVLYKKETSSKTSTTLSFGADFDGKTITKNINDEFTQKATLTPAVEGATIKYTSSNTDVADINDGYVLTHKEGITTITASYAGDDNYKASSVSYTLNVVDNSKTETKLTFQTSAYTYNQGDKNGTAVIKDNKAVLSPTEATGTITYSATGTQGLADVQEDGSVLINTEIVGTATITASFAGNDTYKPSTASYTITVKKVAKDGEFDFSSPELYGYDIPQNNSDKVALEQGATIIAGNVTLTNTKSGSSTTTRFYNNKGTIGLRVYTNATLTISVPEGYVITDIAITANNMDVFTVGILNKNSVDIAFSNYTQMQTMSVKYVKTESLTTAASGFATYAASYDVNYKESGLTAYAVKVSSDNTKVSYTKLEDGVPANIPVLVQGASGQTVTLAPASTTASSVDTDLNMSNGSIVGDGSLIYGFSTKNGVSGFYRVKNGTTVPANKGYIKLSNPSDAKFFSFDGGNGTTGIGSIENIEKQIMLDNATIYNLAGQRVSKSYKGVIIVNGKKMVNK